MNNSLLSTNYGIGLLILIEILLVGVVVALCVKTALIRDSDPNQKDYKLRAFSLAKSQLAFWTVVVIGCFIYLYFKADVFNGVINNTALLLLGISTGTTALSAAAAGPAPAPGVTLQDHKSYFDDILSDAQGMNVHRLQMLIWTVVLGAIFITQTLKSAPPALPQFDDQVYVLMGISSATYVWFKRGEA